MRLDISVKAERRAKGMLEDARGLFETCFEVAVAPLSERLNVGQIGFALGRIFVDSRIVVQQRIASSGSVTNGSASYSTSISASASSAISALSAATAATGSPG